MKTEAQIKVMKLQTKEHQGMPEATPNQKRQGTDPLLEPLDGVHHCQNSILGFWPPEMRKNIILLF